MAPFTRSRKRKASEEWFLTVLQCLADNGWLPDWWEEDYEHLRLVSSATKILVDEAVGPDFEEIVEMLNLRNGFNRETGACHYCSENRTWGDWSPEKCQTCIARNRSGFFGTCHCPEPHRFAPILLEKDPRLKSDWEELPSRERAKLLLRFCRFCVSNFLQLFENTRVEEDDNEEDSENGEEEGSSKIDLTLVEPNSFFTHAGFGDFEEQFKTYNRPIFNLIHNLLMIGMSVNDLGFFEATSISPFESFSPWRENFLYGNEAEREDDWWDYEHNFNARTAFDTHQHMVRQFLQVHQPAEDEEIVVTFDNGEEGESEGLTASQIRYIPKVLYNCIVNSNDSWAEELLGPRIAASIDLYHPAWTTLCENDISLEWMPCLGGDESDYEPLESFDGYNPRTKLIGYACGLDMSSHD